ncbi:MAG: hypothetical protein M3136_11590, partial [Thermoproteota archaeon]|nr:hypothetical protein [Thermoproteota archaeon]
FFQRQNITYAIVMHLHKLSGFFRAAVSVNNSSSLSFLCPTFSFGFDFASFYFRLPICNLSSFRILAFIQY